MALWVDETAVIARQAAANQTLQGLSQVAHTGTGTLRQYYSLEQMIHMRLSTPEGAMQFDCLKAHRCSNKVVVFIVHKDQPIMIEDDHGLFPSDALITKLKLMIG